MIIGLGVLAMTRVLHRHSAIHIHRHLHRHGPHGQSHLHIHFHERGTEPASVAASRLSEVSKPSQTSPTSHSHAISRIGYKPLLVGAMHGLAGSAALTLLVLTQIQSVWWGLLYLTLFGFGSTLGMLLMSGLIGLPFAYSGRRLTKLNYRLQTVASSLSIIFGLWYAYQVGIN